LSALATQFLSLSKLSTREIPFVYVTKEMLGSDAYKKLSNPSRVTLLLLRAQLKNHVEVRSASALEISAILRGLLLATCSLGVFRS